MKQKTLVLFALFISIAIAQTQRDLKRMSYNPPDELVSLSAELPFNKAIQLISKVAKQSINKLIIGGEDNTQPLGIEISSMNWLKALELILKLHKYEFQEAEDYIKIFPQRENVTTIPLPDIMKGVDFETREVSISAVFFEMDIVKSKEMGIDWKWLLSKSSSGLNIAGQLGKVDSKIFQSEETSASQEEANKFQLGGRSDFEILKMSGKITALFNFFESNQLGEIIASPQISVRDRMKGEIQVGSDFSTREKDFAGNTIERFFSTGTIIKVTPYVMNNEETNANYVLLDLSVERSSAIPGQLTTEIKKTKATTNVIMLDGEETVIGGLFVNEETTERTGIPILKDLPWWVLGIRYLTGSDAKVVTKKELIIVLKVKLIPTLSERLQMIKSAVNPIQKRLEENQRQLRLYQFSPEDNQKKD